MTVFLEFGSANLLNFRISKVSRICKSGWECISIIRSKADYKFYIKADKFALGKDYETPRLIGDDIWKSQRLLRKAEYYNNCMRSLISRLYLKYLLFRFYIMSVYLGFSIPINVFGPGLCILHRDTIVINKNARVGENCRIHACTNIGSNRDDVPAPQIGNNVYIGPSAKILEIS